MHAQDALLEAIEVPCKGVLDNVGKELLTAAAATESIARDYFCQM
jgi:hypothetical protein